MKKPRGLAPEPTLLHVTTQKMTLLEKLSTKAEVQCDSSKENLKDQVILYHTEQEWWVSFQGTSF